VKRLFDIVFSTLALTLFAPVMLIVAFFVRLNMGSPVIFRQQRPGLGGKPFMLVKFRSMRDAIGRDGTPLPDADRLTAFGKALRATSLDELPQLWCVLCGHMSLVGPRPMLMDYLPLYTPEQMRRHDVRPGITGWAQVNGRNLLSWDEKFAYDLWYVDHHSFALDMRILWMTLGRIIRRDGIDATGDATMPKFTGKKP
jgi:lipopolysaccharide/colanic/teichoic acid biosynthesis glycosyltransferase